MPNFLFWNLNSKPLDQLVAAEAAKHFDVDVLVLAECSSDPAVTLMQLNSSQTGYFLIQNCCAF